MNSALDLNMSNFFKGFVNNPAGPAQFEDPTYIGFRLVFDFNPTTRNPGTGYTDNALFAQPTTGLDSAQRYLRSIGYPQRAAMLEQFRQQLQFIVNQSPWFFQTLEGLDEIWRIPWGREGWNNYRGKDKKITISCLESIDMRMTSLADLYRKATVDPQTMRSLLPDNLRWFTLKVWLTEIRNFQRVANTANTLGQTSLGTAAQIALGLNNGISSTLGAAAQIAGVDRAQFMDVTGLISLMEFEFSKCEFDFNDSFPTEDPMTNMKGDMQMARSKFSIETHHIKETHTYTLQQLILTEGGDESQDQINGGYFSNGNVTQSQNPTTNQNAFPKFEGAVFPTAPQTSLNSKIAALIQQGKDAAAEAVGQAIQNAAGGGAGSRGIQPGQNALINTPPAPAPTTNLGNAITSQSLNNTLASFGALGNALIDTPPAPVPPTTLGNTLENVPPKPASTNNLGNSLDNTPPAPAPTTNLGEALLDTPPPPAPLNPQNVYK